LTAPTLTFYVGLPSHVFAPVRLAVVAGTLALPPRVVHEGGGLPGSLLKGFPRARVPVAELVAPLRTTPAKARGGPGCHLLAGGSGRTGCQFH
jgi:hypothetical protein